MDRREPARVFAGGTKEVQIARGDLGERCETACCAEELGCSACADQRRHVGREQRHARLDVCECRVPNLVELMRHVAGILDLTPFCVREGPPGGRRGRHADNNDGAVGDDAAERCLGQVGVIAEYLDDAHKVPRIEHECLELREARRVALADELVHDE